MGSPSFTVIAPDPPSAAALLGLVPAGCARHAVLVGVGPENALDDLPAADVCVIPGLGFDNPPDQLGMALRPILGDAEVVLLDASQPGRDLAGWAAVTLDAPLVWSVDRLRLTDDGVLELGQVVLGGSHRLVHVVDGPGPVFVLGKPTGGAETNVRQWSPNIEILEVAVPQSRVRVLAHAGTEAATSRLADSRIVVGIGRGIGGGEHVPLFRALANRLGAALGASRVVVEQGWLPFAHQIGQTGSSISPELYLAFGISGAIQHVAGIRASRCVVAVNTDADAPLSRDADLVVIADAVEVANALLARLDGSGEEDGGVPRPPTSEATATGVHP